ncbi:MAG: M48 family metallopeptidase [Gammaproteobacteria bacterium]|nr:M48 family metallopeptidase [Gammaproteobacteria bacterium]MDH5727449.1 M48 family metallopeptidase [Gammaproteobacteria bacterium]
MPLLPFDYHISHSKRAKRIQIHVDAAGQVKLVVPKRCHIEQAQQLLIKNQAWVLRRQQIAKANRILDPALDLMQPKEIRLLAIGENWSVNYSQHFNSDFTTYTLSLNKDSNTNQQLITWLKLHAKNVLNPWLNDVSQRLDISYNRLSIRQQRSRWGSCSQLGNINLNCNLLFLPKSMVEYLLIHELCHRQHMNHSKSYWALVKHFEPNYKILDRQLTHANRFVPLWALPK